MLDSRILWGLFLVDWLFHVHWNSADKTLIVCEPFAEDHYALARDFIFANILGMISATHLDNHHDLAKLAMEGYVSEPDDVIAKERNGVGTERKFGKGLIHLNRA
jgi:hypothetical protein